MGVAKQDALNGCISRPPWHVAGRTCKYRVDEHLAATSVLHTQVQ